MKMVLGRTGSSSARELYSGLCFLLEERGLTLADLGQRVAALAEAVDARTLEERCTGIRTPPGHSNGGASGSICGAVFR